MKTFKLFVTLFTILTLALSFTACEKDLNEIATSVDLENTGDIEDLDAGDSAKGKKHTNKITDDRMLLVLSAPSVNNNYYYEDFYEIIDFMVDYANTVMHNDNVVVVADKATMPYLKDKLPKDVLLKSKIKMIRNQLKRIYKKVVMQMMMM